MRAKAMNCIINKMKERHNNMKGVDTGMWQCVATTG